MTFVPLTNSTKTAIVDDADAPSVLRFRWYLIESEAGIFYAIRKGIDPTGRRVTIRMHREIMGITDRAVQVDHVDCDGLNNRRSNLRPCTSAQNLANQRKTRGSSRFKGVSWNTNDQRWRMACGKNGITKGYFASEEAAARAYDEAAKKKYGAFARLNFPEDS